MPYRTIDLEALTQYCLNHRDDEIFAGIREDFTLTSDVIWHKGSPEPTSHPFISSWWGTPVIYNATIDEFVHCWIMTEHMCDWDPIAIRLLTLK